MEHDGYIEDAYPSPNAGETLLKVAGVSPRGTVRDIQLQVPNRALAILGYRDPDMVIGRWLRWLPSDIGYAWMTMEVAGTSGEHRPIIWAVPA